MLIGFLSILSVLSFSLFSLTLPVEIRRKQGEEWEPVTTENWPHDKRFRTFLFLYTSARDHHTAFHGITQRVE
jgi:hypothetical protein